MLTNFTFMFSRLDQVLKAEGMSRSQFAEKIGVSPATVSHLLAGRNKPSFEIIQAISVCFPGINLDWLINGTGKMYKSAVQEPVNQDSIFEIQEDSPSVPIVETPSSITPSPKPQITKIQKNISKILVFFDDGSYQEVAVKR